MAKRIFDEDEFEDTRPKPVAQNLLKPDKHFDLSYINTDIPVDFILKVVKNYIEAFKGRNVVADMPMTFLFAGISGSGKSEFAKFIAKKCRKSIDYRQLSDLTSPWVGETEEYITEAFRRADKNKRILLIDECDALFFDRRNAMQMYEVSQVNQLFTQMDLYRSILICTTNILDSMDLAISRRFTFKVNFYPLKDEQKFSIFNTYFSELLGYKIYPCQGKYAEELRAMQSLTPGDVRTVWNKLRFAPNEYKRVEKIMEFLKYELSIKEILNKNYEQVPRTNDSNITELKSDVKAKMQRDTGIKRQVHPSQQLNLWE